MTSSEDAAAYWGSAENQIYPIEQRLTMALLALEFFGNAVDRVEAILDEAGEAGMVRVSVVRKAIS